MKCRLGAAKHGNNKCFLRAEANRYHSASSVLPDILATSVSDTLICETSIQCKEQLNSDNNETNLNFQPCITNYNACTLTLEGSWLRLRGKK
jgi:hypothetical protein